MTATARAAGAVSTGVYKDAIGWGAWTFGTIPMFALAGQVGFDISDVRIVGAVLVIELIITFVERAFFQGNRQWYVFSVFMIDACIKGAGWFPLIMALGGTDLAAMFQLEIMSQLTEGADQIYVASVTGFSLQVLAIIGSVFMGALTAAAPEAIWSVK